MRHLIHIKTLGATAALFLAAAVAADAQGRTPDFTFERTLAAGQTVWAHAVSGNVTVTPSTTGRVHIRAFASGRDGDRYRVETVPTDHGLVVCVLRVDTDDECRESGVRMRSDRNWNVRGSMDLEIQVPPTAQVAAHSVSGDVRVTGARGTVEARTISGNVRVVDVRATSVSAQSVSGNVTVSVESLSGTGELTFKTISGNVTVELPRDLDADVSLRTVSGNVTSDFPMTLSGRIRPRHIEARIGAGGRTLEAATVSGNVRLRQL